MPSVVLINPPFSAVAHVDRRMAGAALRHISSALARLPEGGRLVAITRASCLSRTIRPGAMPSSGLQERGTRRLQRSHRWWRSSPSTAPPSSTRLTVIDKVAGRRCDDIPASPRLASDVATLLGWVDGRSAPPADRDPCPCRSLVRAIPRTVRAYATLPSSAPTPEPDRD